MQRWQAVRGGARSGVPVDPRGVGRARRWPALAVVAALTAAACGGDDDLGDSGTTSTSSSTSAAPTSTSTPDTTTTVGATSTAPTTTEAGSPAAPAPGPTTSTTSTTEPALGLPLSLLADGLGLVSFDQPYVDVVEALTAVLGEPDHVGADVFEPAIGSMRSVTWGHLRVDFTGGAGALYFSGYVLAREMTVEEIDGEFRFVVTEWSPEPWELQLTTEAGIGIDATAEAADAVYPEVYAARCNAQAEPTTLLDDDGTIDQLFVAPQQSGVYLQRPIDGTVWVIGAQVAPNPLLCDGAMP